MMSDSLVRGDEEGAEEGYQETGSGEQEEKKKAGLARHDM
jgi:hypothetical protein